MNIFVWKGFQMRRESLLISDSPKPQSQHSTPPSCEYNIPVICTPTSIAILTRTPVEYRNLTPVSSGNALWDVTQATLINKLLYASPVWWGFMDASGKQQLQSIIAKAVRLGLLPISQAPLSELCEHADQALFSNIVNNHNHVLRNLLPPLKITGHDLRKPTRDRTLPFKEDNGLFGKIFIHRISTNNYFYSKL